MAFPVVETTNTTNGTGASVSPVVNLPTGIVSGNLLIALFRTADGTSGVGWPAGWTELIESTADASNDAIAIGYRQADGTEGTTITLTTSSAKFAAIAYRISGAENPTTQAPQISTVVTGTTTSPDPGSLSPTGGAKDYLWLWMGGWEGEQTSPPAGNPTNYTNPLGANSGTGGAIPTNCRVASAQRTLNAVSEDPGFWTISVSDDWTAWTLAVHPTGTVTTDKTTTALARITATTDKTITTLARVEKTVDQTTIALARITVVVDKTLTALARITATTDKTINSLSRITATTDKTTTAIANIVIPSVDKTITTLGRITVTTDKTIAALARIQQITDKTISALARIAATINKTLTAVGRITATADKTITTLGRILATVDKTLDSKARITAITDKTVNALTRITQITDKTIASLARITKVDLVSTSSILGSPTFPNPLILSHTVPVGNNKVLIVGIGYGFPGAPPTVTITFNGIALTEIITVGGNSRSALYRLVNPPVGTFNVEFTLSAGTPQQIGAMTFVEVDQTNPIESSASADLATSLNPSINITTTNNRSWILDNLQINSAGTSVEPDAGQIKRWQQREADASPDSAQGSTKVTGTAGVYTMSWTMNTSRATRLVVIGLAEAPITTDRTITAKASMISFTDKTITAKGKIQELEISAALNSNVEKIRVINSTLLRQIDLNSNISKSKEYNSVIYKA